MIPHFQRQAQLVANHLPPQREDGAPLSLPDDITQPFRASDGDNLFIVYGTAQRLLATSDPAEAAQAAAYIPAPLAGGFFRVEFMAGHRHGIIGFALRQGKRWVIVLQGREQAAVLLESLINQFSCHSGLYSLLAHRPRHRLRQSPDAPDGPAPTSSIRRQQLPWDLRDLG